MSAEFEQKVRQILEEALELPPAKRMRFLDFACADAPDVRKEVARQLLAQGEMDQAPPPPPGAPPVPSPHPLGKASGRPQKINRYEIKGELGRGAMGAVYEAVDPVIGRTVALKVLHSNLADEAEVKSLEDRLFREASSAGRLAHPGIVTVFDVGKEGEMAFIAMERVDGPTLQHMIKQGRIDRQQTMEILRQAAAALDYAHAEGIIHRDIKPANIMLHKGTQAKIADFGIAKVSAMSQLTVAGTILGTPSYMSPEQIQNLELTGRSDMFSLAVVAYEMLTGVKPFDREAVAALLLMIVNGERPLASKADPTLPAMVDEVFQMALNRLPEQRFATCTAFVCALASAAGIEFAPAERTTGSIRTGQTGPRTMPPPPPPPQFSTPAPDFGSAPTLVQTAPHFPAPSLTPPPPAALHQAETAKPSRTWIYFLGGLLVILLAAAYPIYRYVYPKPAPEPKTSDPISQKKPADLQNFAPPDQPKASEGGEKELPKEIIGGETSKPPAEPKKAPNPVEPPHTEPKPTANAGQAQKIYEEAMAKRSQGGAAVLPLLEQAAGMGEPRAMLELGKIYSAGDGVAKDPAKAAGWFRKAADLGNSSAMVFLGALYAQGSGVPRDMSEAAKWLRKAADAGNAVAMDGLGQMYQNGQGVQADAAQAEAWYRKAAAANNATGMYHLGLLLEAKNPAEAAQLFQRAAQAGYQPAKAKLISLKPLTLTGIDKGGITENKSQLYRLSGSGFSAATTVTSTAFQSIGSRDGQYDHRPTAVAPDGSWLAIYMFLPPQQGSGAVKISVKNPSGPAATLDFPIQR